MLLKGRLVVKLPETRVEKLINDGVGERFDAHVAVPVGPGLGIEVDEDALRHLDARTRR